MADGTAPTKSVDGAMVLGAVRSRVWRDPMLRYVDKADREDIAAAVIEHVYTSTLEAWDGKYEPALVAMCNEVCRWKIADYFRTRARVERRNLFGCPALGYPPPTPLQILLAEENTRIVRAALDGLCAAEAEALLARADGERIHETAARSGCAPPQVSRRLHAGLRKIRQATERAHRKFPHLRSDVERRAIARHAEIRA